MNMDKCISLTTVMSQYPGGGGRGAINKNTSGMVSIRYFMEVSTGNSGGTKEGVIN